jgi:hypothetical protein
MLPKTILRFGPIQNPWLKPKWWSKLLFSCRKNTAFVAMVEIMVGGVWKNHIGKRDKGMKMSRC